MRPMNFVRLGEVAELLEVELTELGEAITRVPPTMAKKFADFVYEKQQEVADAK